MCLGRPLNSRTASEGTPEGRAEAPGSLAPRRLPGYLLVDRALLCSRPNGDQAPPIPDAAAPGPADSFARNSRRGLDVTADAMDPQSGLGSTRAALPAASVTAWPTRPPRAAGQGLGGWGTQAGRPSSFLARPVPSEALAVLGSAPSALGLQRRVRLVGAASHDGTRPVDRSERLPARAYTSRPL